MSNPVKYRKKAPYTKRNAKLTTRQKKEVKQIVKGNIELKSIDSIGVGVTSNTTPTVAKWLTISQGTGNSQRVGNEVTISHVELRYNILPADATNVFRFILFQWLEDDVSVNPVADDILYRGGTLVPYTNALYNFEKRHSYRILYDRRHMIDLDNPSGTANFGADSNIKISHKKVQYNGTALDGKGMIYGLFVSDSGVASHPAVDVSVRALYRDA